MVAKLVIYLKIKKDIFLLDKELYLYLKNILHQKEEDKPDINLPHHSLKIMKNIRAQ